ncbi:PD40 domain-containing protein [Labilibaculum filiforme]|nr:PD40 domain-containing protein [Labilibaculum filiforme]
MIWKSTTAIFLFVFLVSGNIIGQELLSVKKSEFIDNVPDRRSEFAQVKEAGDLYQKGIGYVAQSLNLFLNAHKLNNYNPELNYNIGVCYLIAGPKEEALSYLLAAQTEDAEISADIHFLIGLAYKYQNNFSDAIIHFKMNKEVIQQKKYKEHQELLPISDKHIQECRNGRDLLENSIDINLKLVEGNVNSEFDEFNPQIIDSSLFFSSRRGVEKDSRSPEDQKFFEKLFKSSTNNLSIKEVNKEINNWSENVNSTLLAKFDKEHFVFYSSDSGLGDLFFAEKVKGKWQLGKAIKFINEKDSRESSASLPLSGDEIYFVSNRKGGFGDCDIYYCKKDLHSKWSKPINIGGDINTEFDEGDVFVSADGSKLFFSSKGHNSMGGYDIFQSDRLQDGSWGSPQNMGFPINSATNDITYSEDENGNFYFASERSGGKGGFDIYCNKQPEPVVKEEVVAEVEEPEIPAELIPEVKIDVPLSLPLANLNSETVVLPETPVKQELVEEDFVYRVQIAASRKEMNPNDLFSRYKGGDVIDHLFVENWHKYTIGGFLTFKEAAQYRDACGVKDAFVVLFKGGYRLGIARRPFEAN